ncbi:hypothetical protein Ndes2526B_g04689 [Nannochloris sp. 'desiccata']|nr:hypothetical protein NADE_003380 [Chlorella desiccata (nom. nud.)]
MGRGDLARNQERKVHREREHHFNIQSSKDFYSEAKFYETNSKSVQRAIERAAANEKAAAEYERSQQEAAEAGRAAQLEAQRKAEEDRAADEEHRLVEEQEVRKRRQRQAIINASPELVKVKAKIEAAKVAHEQHGQLKLALFAAELEEQNDALYSFNEAQQRAMASHQEDKQARSQKAKELEARLALQAQLRERDALRAAAKEEALKDRATIQQMIEREKQQAAFQRLAQAQRQRDLAAEAQTFMALQRELRERQRAAEAEEERKIQEYLRIRKERHDQISRQRAQRKAAVDEHFEKARLAAEEERFRIEEEEALLDMLRAEMDVQRAREEAAEAASRRANQKKELLEARDLAAKLKQQREATDSSREAEYRQKLIEKMAEEDKIAKMNAVSRRLAVAEHLKEAARCVAYKKKLAEAIIEEEAAAALRLTEKEAEKRGIIEEERLRLLAEAAKSLNVDCRHMPRGLLERPEDLKIVSKYINDAASDERQASS